VAITKDPHLGIVERGASVRGDHHEEVVPCALVLGEGEP